MPLGVGRVAGTVSEIREVVSTAGRSIGQL
jgi:hypothetical protein